MKKAFLILALLTVLLVPNIVQASIRFCFGPVIVVKPQPVYVQYTAPAYTTTTYVSYSSTTQPVVIQQPVYQYYYYDNSYYGYYDCGYSYSLVLPSPVYYYYGNHCYTRLPVYCPPVYCPPVRHIEYTRPQPPVYYRPIPVYHPIYRNNHR